MIQLLNEKLTKLEKSGEHEENEICSFKQLIHFMVDEVDKENDHIFFLRKEWPCSRCGVGYKNDVIKTYSFKFYNVACYHCNMIWVDLCENL